jgi:hypothetical protein
MSTDFFKPPSHHTFTFGSITISSDFDSGNLSYVEKLGFSSVKLSIILSIIYGLEQIILKIIIGHGFIFPCSDSLNRIQ